MHLNEMICWLPWLLKECILTKSHVKNEKVELPSTQNILEVQYNHLIKIWQLFVSKIYYNIWNPNNYNIVNLWKNIIPHDFTQIKLIQLHVQNR